MKLPPMKAPAGLYLKPAEGEGPSAMGYPNAWQFGTFGDLAFLAAHLDPQAGDEIWIESIERSRFSLDEIRAAFDRGLITKVN